MEDQPQLAKIDFVRFGVVHNELLLEQVYTVLEETRARGELDIQRVLFYFPRFPTDPLTDSFRLLTGYQRMKRQSVFVFHSPMVDNPLQALLQSRTELEAFEHPVCKTALEIIKEYEIYCWHRDQARKHKAVQKGLLSRNRKTFFELLVLRDGKQCAHCKSKRKKLLIDHKKPVSKGGFTELVNLQLLCFGCNSKKSSKFPYSVDESAAS